MWERILMKYYRTNEDLLDFKMLFTYIHFVMSSHSGLISTHGGKFTWRLM